MIGWKEHVTYLPYGEYREETKSFHMQYYLIYRRCDFHNVDSNLRPRWSGETVVPGYVDVWCMDVG